jgi:hypothetical protein
MTSDGNGERGEVSSLAGAGSAHPSIIHYLPWPTTRGKRKPTGSISQGRAHAHLMPGMKATPA